MNRPTVSRCKYLMTDAFNGADNIQISAADSYAVQVKLYGVKATSLNAAPTVNSAAAYAGWEGIGETGPRMTDEIPADAQGVILDIPEHGCVNLKHLYVFGASGDKVLVSYVPAGSKAPTVAP